VETLVAAARTNNFEIRSREMELAQQGLRVDLTKNERWPTVTAGPFYSQEKADEKERVVGVGISMPLPLWNRNAGNIEAARARTQQAEAAFFVTHREVEKEVRERAAAYNAFVDQMSFWRTNALDQLREAAELGDRHYRLGSLPVATYVELQDKFIEATEAILDTQRDAMESLQGIERLIGEPIFAKSREKEGK
jgi:outer membrane protein, heavy metal efflux system